MGTKHGLYAVAFDSTLVGGITQQSIATGSDVRGEASSGEVYRRIVALYEQKIAPGFTTKAIAQALDACGPNGASIDDMAAGFSLYAQKHQQGGGRAGAGTHRKFNFLAGIVAPRSLSCSHRGDAELSYESVVGYDGNNDPLVITDSVSVPAISADQRFTLGDVTIGGVSLAQKVTLSIDFGVDMVGEGADSDIWDTIVSIREIASSITIDGIDIEWLKAANIPLTGKAAVHADTSIQLRKRAVAGQFDAGSEITFTAAGLIVPDTAFEASGNDAGRVKMTMPCYYDGTNDPITVST